MEALEEQEKLLKAHFESDLMKNQIKSWKQQSTMLRGLCKQFWEDYGSVFAAFWLEADITIRLALTQTAMEDLPSACSGPLLELTCPELADVEALTRVDEDGGVKLNKLLILMEQVCKGEENKECGLHQGLKEHEQAAGDKKPPSSVAESLFVVRSCVLLQYFTAIELVWQQLAGEQREEG